MGGFAMPTFGAGGGKNTIAPTMGTASTGGAGTIGLGKQLYAGATNATGSPMPVPAAPPSSPIASPATTAPAGLNVSQNPGSTSVNNATGTTGSDASRLLGENQNYFGQGVGSALTNYLNSGGGYNGAITQQTVNATDAAMQGQINQQYGDLETSLSNAGLSPNSSAAALAKSNFLSNASTQENQVAAQQYSQMWSQSQSQYLSALQMVAGVNAQGTANQQTALGALGSFATGGLGGLLQYTGGNAGLAGNVTSTSGLFSGNGSTAGFEGGSNSAQSVSGAMF